MMLSGFLTNSSYPALALSIPLRTYCPPTASNFSLGLLYDTGEVTCSVTNVVRKRRSLPRRPKVCEVMRTTSYSPAGKVFLPTVKSKGTSALRIVCEYPAAASAKTNVISKTTFAAIFFITFSLLLVCNQLKESFSGVQQGE